MSTRALGLVLAALALVGCDDSPIDPDAGLMRDAAVGDGGGIVDAGSVDAAIPASDAGAFDAGLPLCDTAVCDPRAPTASCGEDACVLWTDSPSCDDASGALLTAGDACTEAGECGPGMACFLDGTSGVCARICCPEDGSACAIGSRCGGSGTLVDGTETLWGRCLAVRSCDLLRPEESCEDREACYLIDTTLMTECRIAGTAGPGEACEVQEDCRAGFFCGGIAAARRCTRLCDLRETAPCPMAEGNCVAQTHTPDGVGLCTLDMMSARQNR